MARKPADIGDLARALKAPAFGHQSVAASAASLDPVSPTTLVLRVAEIKAYEHNPRHAENREYPRLKDSIRSRRGLTTPLTVTKRPGDDRYTIAAGGNSRLRALKELADETHDDAFAVVTCLFEPWSTECQVLANHLIENDMRGSILFGDKASAIVGWRTLYEEAHPDETPLSQRVLAERLAESGYRIPQSLLNRLLYTAETLLPLLPNAFASGLGRQSVEELIRLRTCCERYWQESAARSDRGPGTTTFDEVFAATCKEQDCHCADWDPERFQNALAIRMAETLAIDHKLVALDVDGAYRGYLAAPASAPPPTPSLPAGPTSEWAFERSRQIESLKRERARARLAARKEHHTAPRPAASGDENDVDRGAALENTPVGTNPRQVREQNYVAARRLAQRHDLEAFLRPSNTGFGFFIEAPEPSTVAPEATRQPTGPGQGLVLAGARSAVWWFFCVLLDQLTPAALEALGNAYPASWLVELFSGLPRQSPDADPRAALHLLVGEPSVRSVIWDILTEPSLAAEDVAALTELLHGCRMLRQAAASGGIVLWEIDT